MFQTEKILELLNKSEIFQKDDFFTEEDAWGIYEAVKDDFSCKLCSGVSKAVLYFPDMDKVVKVPFNGSIAEIEKWDAQSDEYFYEWDAIQFEYSPAMNSNWDYCLAEVDIYTDAESYGLGECFAKTELIGQIHNHYPVYAQEKCSIFRYQKREYSEEKRKSIKNYLSSTTRNSNTLSELWLSDFLEYFGKEVLDDFLDFLDERGINDLHNSNIGYIGDRPVLIDYCGWYD